MMEAATLFDRTQGPLKRLLAAVKRRCVPALRLKSAKNTQADGKWINSKTFSQNWDVKALSLGPADIPQQRRETSSRPSPSFTASQSLEPRSKARHPLPGIKGPYHPPENPAFLGRGTRSRLRRGRNETSSVRTPSGPSAGKQRRWLPRLGHARPQPAGEPPSSPAVGSAKCPGT